MHRFERTTKIQVNKTPTPTTTGKAWEQVIKARFSDRRKGLNEVKPGGISIFDLTGPLLKRRQKALVNSMPEIYKRYKAPETYQDVLGETWIGLNLPFLTYTHMDAQSHILFAASSWILDQIVQVDGWRHMYEYLPKDSELLDDMYHHAVWTSDHEDELVYSVEYVLRNRNPIELDGEKFGRVLTSELLANGRTKSNARARGKTKGKKKDQSQVVSKQQIKTDQQAEYETNRENYEQLIALIPQEAKDRAVARFRDYYWKWVDRFFAAAQPFFDELVLCQKRIQMAQVEYNETVDEFNSIMKRLNRAWEQKQTPNFPLNRPDGISNLVSDLFGAVSSKFDSDVHGTGYDKTLKPQTDFDLCVSEGVDAQIRLKNLSELIDLLDDRMHDLSLQIRYYSIHMGSNGRIMGGEEEGVPPMEPMKIDDPFELCFALLYLIESDDDLPWLYGAGCGLMSEVTDALPWGISEYSEIDDDIWNGPEEETTYEKETTDGAVIESSINAPTDTDCLSDESTGLPSVLDGLANPYDRIFTVAEDGDSIPRSFAQIVYEQSGCVLPKNIHRYDRRLSNVEAYGITGKDAAWVLMLMNAMTTIQHSTPALNLDWETNYLVRAAGWNTPDDDSVSNDTEQKNEGASAVDQQKPVDVDELKAEIKRLRSALHSSEKESREIKKTLADVREKAEREHRELADLREYVFQREENADADASSVETKSTDGTSIGGMSADTVNLPAGTSWPYEVQRNTLVFGGHPAWVNGIKTLLTGNIRFIDKGFVFDTGIIRRADVIWIQPNAIPHKMYNRIIDGARQYGKPVRYFASAGWIKCAEQFVAAEK